MSLDQNLFTLIVTPHPENPHVIDLVDPSKGEPYYRKQRVPGPTYCAEVYDPNSQSLLAIASAPSATSKTKTLELQNPTVAVELRSTGTLTFKWSFKWEDHEFEWRREECFLIRKPDPAVLVAITKEPAGKLKTSAIQLLDYNLNRFDVQDRKGLEIIILTALLTFNDANEAYHDRAATSGPNLKRNPSSTASVPTSPSSTITDSPPPPLPMKPPAKSGVDRIAELQALRSEVNEVNVEEEGSVEDYALYAFNLLQDDAMLFISVRSADAVFVPKVLQVVEETKRLRHKNNLEDEEFHQYVVYDEGKKKGPRRINLDTNAQDDKPTYEPPMSLCVHLSKIPMPELQPKPSSSSSPNPPPPSLPEAPSSIPDTKAPKGSLTKDTKEKKKKKGDEKGSSSFSFLTPTTATSHKLSKSRDHSAQILAHRHSHQTLLPDPHPNSSPMTYDASSSSSSTSTPSLSSLTHGLMNRLHIPAGGEASHPGPTSASSLSGMLDRFKR